MHDAKYFNFINLYKKVNVFDNYDDHNNNNNNNNNTVQQSISYSNSANESNIANESNAWQNHRRIKHACKAGNEVSLEKPGIAPKMSAPRTGPHTAQQVSTNGTVHIKDGMVAQWVNIQSLMPHFE